MKQAGNLERGVVIFLSDHGSRNDKYAETSSGKMEKNLPFLFIAFPNWYYIVKVSSIISNYNLKIIRCMKYPHNGFLSKQEQKFLYGSKKF